VRLLFDDLETKRCVIDLLGRAEGADGARIFIGSENKLFSLSGSSTNRCALSRRLLGRIIGVIGVIGPTRLKLCPRDPDGGLHRPGGEQADRWLEQRVSGRSGGPPQGC